MNEEVSTTKDKVIFDRKSNLTPGGPGRPKGQRNYSTIYKEALMKIAEAKDLTPEQLETQLEEVGLMKALEGDHKFWVDIRDRIHGKAVTRSENLNINKDMDKLPEEDKERLSKLLNE